MTQPKLSIITPSFNQGAFIERTIDSVLTQGYQNLEFIIIDGGSTDQSVDVIKKYERHLTYWVSERDRGQSHAINKGFSRSSGDCLTWLNSDDWYPPDTLSIVAETFISKPAADIVVGSGEMIDIHGLCTEILVPPAVIDKVSLLDWFDGKWFLQPASFFRRTAWEQCGPLDENQHLTFDIAFYLAAAEQGFKYVTVPKTLARALRHPDAKTTVFSWRVFMEGALLMEAHGKSGEVRKVFERLTTRLEGTARAIDWYEANYLNTVRNPFVRMVRPLAKMMARSEEQFWRDKLPDWVRNVR